jgi:hypothetical protein
MRQKQIDFSKMDFDEYQMQDLMILMSLRTPAQVQEWSKAVGPAETCYGLSLLECAALFMLDADVADMREYPEASIVIDKVKKGLS